jgi:hypothetical protein
MRPLRLVSVCVVVLTATLVAGAALAKSPRPVPAPNNLHGFLLRPNETPSRDFARTPSFAWNPVRGATCYEFELATSSSFSESSIIWSNVRYGVKPGTGCAAVSKGKAVTSSPSPSTPGGTATATPVDPSTPTAATEDPAVTTVIQPLRVPATSIDVALPWFTGQPYALHAHVRAITDRGPTRWSTPFSFNMRWQSVPKPLAAPSGLVRWTPIQGANGYQVWYVDAGKVFSTHTNVADQREHFSFHAANTFYQSVRWRVRAVRRIFGEIPNGLPAVSYGPWSPIYIAANPDPAAGPLTLTTTISDTVGTPSKPKKHELMPALTFSGNQGLDGVSYGLFRMYAFTDSDCVNMVYRGAVVGSPAYAPRTTGPLKLPFTDEEISNASAGWLPDAKDEGKTIGADGTLIKTSEAVGETSTGGASAGTGDAAGAGTSLDATQTVAAARVDLPEVDFPRTRYYWTIVPVTAISDSAGNRQYQDVDLPQDACAAGRVASFGKVSKPVRTASPAPYIAGLTPNGRLLTSTGAPTVVYSTPLVAWEPALGATAYEVQWSRTSYPWRAQGSKQTYSTAAVLDLAPGTWFYRVRGLNQLQAKKPEMAWSSPIRLRIATPKFAVEKG